MRHLIPAQKKSWSWIEDTILVRNHETSLWEREFTRKKWSEWHRKHMMAASHVLGSAKIFEHCVYVYVLAPTLSAPALVQSTHSIPQCLLFLSFNVYSILWRLTGIRLPTVKWLFFHHTSSTQHHVHFLTTKQRVSERWRDQEAYKGGEVDT